MGSEASPVAIVGGTGALGFGLALRLVRAGTPVVIGSRDEARAEEAAARVREKLGDDAPARGAVNQEAVRDVPAVFLCVPFRRRRRLQPNDIFITMGAGDVHEVAEALVRGMGEVA